MNVALYMAEAPVAEAPVKVLGYCNIVAMYHRV